MRALQLNLLVSEVARVSVVVVKLVMFIVVARVSVVVVKLVTVFLDTDIGILNFLEERNFLEGRKS